MKKVTVVILNFKVCDLTLKCINSVKKSSHKNLQIIVVDNNSNDNLGESLKNDKEIYFIQNDDNLGFAGGMNVGIKEALKNKADFVFVLNPDTTIEKDTIKILVEKADKYNAQILCPKIYFDDSNILWYAGKVFDRANVLGLHRGVDQEDKGQFDQDEEQETATGAAMLVQKEVFEEVGFFDDRYFLYYEEDDLCARAKMANFKIMYIHDSIVYHKNAQSTGLGTPLQDYFITRNRLLYASKFLSIRTRFALIREALRNYKIPTRRQGLWDFLTSNFGQGSFKIN